MIIIKDTINFKLTDKTAVSIGKFDGLHKGHGKIIERLREFKEKGLKTAVFSFDIPPNAYFSGKEQKVLLTGVEKRRVFEDLSIDYLIEFPNVIFVKAGEAASNTQDYVSMTGQLAVANLFMQLILMAVDIVICIWIWKWHMKDVDFEEIRKTW